MGSQLDQKYSFMEIIFYQVKKLHWCDEFDLFCIFYVILSHEIQFQTLNHRVSFLKKTRTSCMRWKSSLFWRKPRKWFCSWNIIFQSMFLLRHIPHSPYGSSVGRVKMNQKCMKCYASYFLHLSARKPLFN